MTIENATIQATTTKKKRSFVRTLLRITLATSFVLGVGLFTAHLVWKSSGSGKWQLEIDKDGVQVYSMKSPGSTLKHFKIVGRLKTTLHHVVAVFNDTSLEHCKEWLDCSSASAIEPWNPEGHYLIALYQVDLFPGPVSAREFLLKYQFSQDPQSKALSIDVTAVPELLPENKCCVRVTHLHNRWLWTPLKNGEVEVEVVEDADLRLPYVLANARAKLVWEFMSAMPGLMDRERYPNENEKFDFVQEPAAETAAAIESCKLTTAGCGPLRRAAK
jgi:START domain-containing protein